MSPRNSELSDDFRDCIDALNEHEVSFVLVGGYAVGYHGVVRATGDIEFLYEQTPENVERLCTALQDFGAPEHLIDRECCHRMPSPNLAPSRSASTCSHRSPA